MTDYNLYRGDNITITSDTVVENFYYHGGSIKVNPSVAFVLTGDFIFHVDDTEDPVGYIFGALLARVALETGRNGMFAGFKTYDLYPQNTPLFFPCIVFDKQPQSEITTNFFGGEWLETVDVVCELAFKSDKYVDIGGTSINKKALAEHYMWYMRQILNDITYQSEYINVGNVDIDTSIQEPEAPDQKLYGFSLQMSLEFKKYGALE